MPGVSGDVVEVGVGNGLNFSHYPATSTRVVAVEPEPHLRALAEQAARRAQVPATVMPRQGRGVGTGQRQRRRRSGLVDALCAGRPGSGAERAVSRHPPGGVSCGSSNTWRWRGWAPHRAEGGGCDHLAVSDWRLLHRPGSCCCHLASRSWPRAVASTAVPEFAFGCRQRHTCSESLDDHTADGNPGQCRDGDARSRHRLVSAAGSTDQRNTSSTVTAVTTTREVAGGPSEDD